MTCPWYITATSIRDLLVLDGRAAAETDGPAWASARRVLEEAAAHARSAQDPRVADNGLRTYRMGRPRRYRLMVSDAPHPSGLPQLVQVLPDRIQPGERGPRPSGWTAPTPRHDPTITIRPTSEQRAWLEREAGRERMSVADVISSLIDEEMEREEGGV